MLSLAVDFPQPLVGEAVHLDGLALLFREVGVVEVGGLEEVSALVIDGVVVQLRYPVVVAERGVVVEDDEAVEVHAVFLQRLALCSEGHMVVYLLGVLGGFVEEVDVALQAAHFSLVLGGDEQELGAVGGGELHVLAVFLQCVPAFQFLHHLLEVLVGGLFEGRHGGADDVDAEAWGVQAGDAEPYHNVVGLAAAGAALRRHDAEASVVGRLHLLVNTGGLYFGYLWHKYFTNFSW